MLPKGLPEHTLGWEVLSWGSQMLAQPDGNRNYEQGAPWQYTNEQAMFILWFYAVDEYGRFKYRNAVIERPKGWGKSPLLAAICCTEFLGPTNFAGWDANGNPVGKPTASPLVQIAAISDSQAENTMSLVREMLSGGQVMYHYPYLDINLAKITYPGGKKLEKVTASPRGREGNRATFVVMDETHLWVPAEQGPQLYEALARNLGKMDHRWVATTNAHLPGEGSVAETHYNSYQKMSIGEAFDKGLLFDTREVFVEDVYDPTQAIPALRTVYGDAGHPVHGWINLDRIWAEINDPSTPEHVARRYYFNQHIEGHSTWLNPSLWKGCQIKKFKKLKRTDPIAVGVKAVTKKGCAIVACRLTDMTLFELAWWENPGTNKKWELPTTEVDAKVRKILAEYNVFKLFSDPQPLQDIIGKWYADYEDEVEEFWISTKTKMARACEQFEASVYDKRLLNTSKAVDIHVRAAHTEEVTQGYVIRQETRDSKRYIFGAQAAVLAVEAGVTAIEEGALKVVDDTIYGY